MKAHKLPQIVIVGRPNVGKSSLFNRIAGRRTAIVDPLKGTTRDRIHADVSWKGRYFTVVDTGGYDPGADCDMSRLVLSQLEKGIREADIVVFVTDGIAGMTHQDKELAEMLRKTFKKTYLVVNKIDEENDAQKAFEFYELGLGEPYAISAMHNKGIGRLCDELADAVGVRDINKSGGAVRVAIVGRPNVGKSSYLNSILDEERAIVHLTAGTTRDAIDTDFNYGNRDYVLIDTAGIRHDAKIGEAADFYGTVRSKEALRRCDVAILLIDGYDGLREDDARIIAMCREAGKGLVLAVNKWDMVKGAEMAGYRNKLIKKLAVIRCLPVLFVSCKTGRNIKHSLDVIWAVYERSKTIVRPDSLSSTLDALNGAVEIRNKGLRFKGLVQEGALPPKFVLSVNKPRSLNENTRRFVENFFRSVYDLEGVPLRLCFENRCRTD